ncbi:hypothetical protein G6F64_015516 [Rhizopus arrhizus]|uniref:Uncharacterized protein n=1 Tax=Rhizopus oryzae TaxID=64495 RepID=A0A9P6WR71_RHIOR|nr:hypothetical protein G6F64_015516 [Rhizopus arrhizus]
MHLRMQAAAQCDIQLLEAAADRQHRQVQRQRLLQHGIDFRRKGVGPHLQRRAVEQGLSEVFLHLLHLQADGAG